MNQALVLSNLVAVAVFALFFATLLIGMFTELPKESLRVVLSVGSMVGFALGLVEYNMLALTLSALIMHGMLGSFILGPLIDRVFASTAKT